MFYLKAPFGSKLVKRRTFENHFIGMTMTGLSITVLDHILLYSIAYFVKVTVLNFIVCFS